MSITYYKPGYVSSVRSDIALIRALSVRWQLGQYILKIDNPAYEGRMHVGCASDVKATICNVDNMNIAFALDVW